jgi:hypothetical protein
MLLLILFKPLAFLRLPGRFYLAFHWFVDHIVEHTLTIR